jgi:hypothetical protein
VVCNFSAPPSFALQTQLTLFLCSAKTVFYYKIRNVGGAHAPRFLVLPSIIGRERLRKMVLYCVVRASRLKKTDSHYSEKKAYFRGVDGKGALCPIGVLVYCTELCFDVSLRYGNYRKRDTSGSQKVLFSSNYEGVEDDGCEKNYCSEKSREKSCCKRRVEKRKVRQKKQAICLFY